MPDIVRIEAYDLVALARLASIIAKAEDYEIYRVRAAIDGGLKLKVNEATWSPALGRLEV